MQGRARFVEAGLLHPPQPVETVDELALRERRGERHRHKAGILFQRDLDLRQKLVETDAVPGRDGDGIDGQIGGRTQPGEQIVQRRLTRSVRRQAVDLVEGRHHRLVVGAQLLQHVDDRLHLLGCVRDA